MFDSLAPRSGALAWLRDLVGKFAARPEEPFQAAAGALASAQPSLPPTTTVTMRSGCSTR